MTYTLEYINGYGSSIKFNLTSGYVISNITGLSENIIELPTSQGINQIGTTVQGQSIQGKDIVVNGEIIGQATKKKQAMIDTILPGTMGRIIFNNTYFLEVYPKNTPILERYTTNAKFQFTLYAGYPYWRKTTGIIDTVAGLRPLFKFPWNMQIPYQFSERTSEAAANIYNPSNIETQIKVVFRAITPVLKPKVIKVSTRQSIGVSTLLQAGETVTIDATGGGVDVYSNLNGVITENVGYLDIDSSIFTLSPGDNILRYEAESNPEGLDVRVYFNETFVGVVS